MTHTPLTAIDLTTLVAAFDLLGSFAIVGYLIAALVTLLQRRRIERAQLLVANGALWGLSVKTAATLLHTITLHSLQGVAPFVAIFTLRTLLKRAFAWQRRIIERAPR